LPPADTRQPPIAHRDLKSANLLVNADWQVKVCGK
jgi:serine/threonine protein kinase